MEEDTTAKPVVLSITGTELEQSTSGKGILAQAR
jgi:hypothetical protein